MTFIFKHQNQLVPYRIQVDAKFEEIISKHANDKNGIDRCDRQKLTVTFTFDHPNLSSLSLSSSGYFCQL